MKTVKNASGISFTKIKENKKILMTVVLFLAVVIVILILGNTLKQKKQRITCKPAGCSKQLCVSSDTENIITTCEWKDEYKCYQEAKCEVQKNGLCGFTKDDKFKECMKGIAPSIQEARPIIKTVN